MGDVYSVDPGAAVRAWLEAGRESVDAAAQQQFFLEPDDDGADYCEACARAAAREGQSVVNGFCGETGHALPLCSACGCLLYMTTTESAARDAKQMLDEGGFDPTEPLDCFVASIAAELDTDALAVVASGLCGLVVDWGWMHPLSCEVPRE